MASKVLHSVKQAENCTTSGVSALTGANGFAFNNMFLLGEGEGNLVFSDEGVNAVTCHVEDVAATL